METEVRELRPNPYCVLVVDDTDMQAEAYIHELGRISGFQAKRAVSGQQAALMLEEKPYHAVVIDRMMPNLSGQMSDTAGIELLKHIKEKYPQTTCLILTAEPEFKTYKEAQAIGLFDYFSKEEVGPRELASRMVDILNKRLTFVHTAFGLPTKVDPLYFYGQRGKIVKLVSDAVGEDAGTVQLGPDTWKATIAKDAIERILKPGREVLARVIRRGAVEVVASQLQY